METEKNHKIDDTIGRGPENRLDRRSRYFNLFHGSGSICVKKLSERVNLMKEFFPTSHNHLGILPRIWLRERSKLVKLFKDLKKCGNSLMFQEDKLKDQRLSKVWFIEFSKLNDRLLEERSRLISFFDFKSFPNSRVPVKLLDERSNTLRYKF